MLKGKTPLLIALVLGVFAGVVAWQALRKKETDVKAGWNLVPVLVAKRDIDEGTIIDDDLIQQRQWPEKFASPSVIRPDSINTVRDQRVLVQMNAGDPFMWSQFESTRTSEYLSKKVLKKSRALTIEARGVSAVGGWVRPNDHVDVIGTFKDPRSNETVAVTLMQNVIVLATGKITGDTNVKLLSESQRGYQDVTLQVFADEVELLVLARELGSLTLTLRNEEDISSLEDRSHVTIDTLLSGERVKALQKMRNTITVIRGGTSSTETIKGE